MKTLRFWLGAVIIMTVIFGTAYALSQHVLRATANDPQVQLAYDAASHLNSGSTIESITETKADAGSSLAPFLVIYDRNGRPAAGTGMIDGKLPIIPFGVLKNADQKGYNAVTWQPQADLRFAAVAVASKQYYVVSARSLYLTEKREDETLLMAIAGWGATVLIILAMMAMSRRRHS